MKPNLNRVSLTVAGAVVATLAFSGSIPAAEKGSGSGEEPEPGSATSARVEAPAENHEAGNHRGIAALDRIVASYFPSQIAHVDPETGGLASEPAPSGVSPVTQFSARTDVGLTEVALPGGGAIVDLEDRYLSVLFVTVPPDLTKDLENDTDADEEDSASTPEKKAGR